MEPSLNLTKADRLIYGDSAMTHAMVFTAVSFDVSRFIIKANYYDLYNKMHFFLNFAG